MYVLFDEVGLLIILVGSFFGGFLPLLILLMITPEAREHIKCRIMGGIMILKFWDTGQCEYTVAQEKGGEGQYIAGKNKFGQREIFIKPRMATPFMVKPFLLKGMRRLIYFCYAGKTPIVNPETLMAIETVEAPDQPIILPTEFRSWANKNHPKILQAFDDEANNGGSDLRVKDLPPEVAEWAKQNSISVQEPVYGDVLVPKFSQPDKNGLTHYVGNEKVRQVVGNKDVFHNLSSLDARKLKHYFSDHYDESQIDNLLEAARIEGLQEGREGKRFQIGMLGKIAIAFIVIAVIGVIVIIGLQGGL
jgi:hypothetical protein